MMINKTYKYIIIILGFIILGNLASSAQESQAKASMDTSRILIGDHVNIILELNQDKSKKFEFPVFTDTIIDKVEVLSVTPVDTIKMEDRLKLRQHLVVTSFDTGFYVIPSFIFRDRLSDDSIKSNALPLEVFTMEIDTTKGITDIKLPFDVPLGFWEIAPYIFVVILLLAIAFFIWYYYRKKKNTVPEPVVRAKPAEPAHTWALRELDRLAAEKLWQKGKIKLFHSRLTDIIRTYIEYRFNVQAMEYTTSETIDACSLIKEVPEDICTNLQAMLELADLVKFAKWNPLPDENERSEQIAYDFVLRTKKIIILRKEDEEKAGGENNSEKEDKEVDDAKKS